MSSFGSKNTENSPKPLGRLGTMTTRLAQNQSEIKQAQALRHRVFFQERGRTEEEDDFQLPLDQDAFDAHCDHLLVLDGDVIVGTYRLMPGDRMKQAGGFYSAQEFDLTALINSQPASQLLELGRSCILKEYRNKRTMELLWGGTWAYAVEQGTKRLFGCASFEGTDCEAHAMALTFLAQSAVLEPHEDCPAAAMLDQNQIVDLSIFAKADPVNPRHAMRHLPPLLKGYLRLNAHIASTAIIDHEFNTIDVLVVLDVERINPRYIAHYGADASRYRS